LNGSQQRKDQDRKTSTSIYRVKVIMDIENEKGEAIRKREIDLGKMNDVALDELNELFSLMSKDIEQIKKLEPHFEKLGKRKPEYVS
jgi:hypothetical protein